MPSRRDQVQSYQFFVQRLTSALVAREPDPEAAPFRRLGGAGLGGIMIAVLVLAGAGVYGILRPGGATSWKEGDAVIVEKETGTRYIYRKDEDRLHPVANFASALLALGSSSTLQVSRNSLTGTSRGTVIGIPDAPDSLPDPKRMLDGPWTLCSQPTRDEAGERVATTVLTVGRRIGGGRDPQDAALLVRDDATEVLYLVWRDHRYEIKDKDTVVEGLTLISAPVVAAGGAWLNALPAGEPIGPLSVAGRGGASSAVPGGVIGRVYGVESAAGGRQYYLAKRSALVPITELQASVQLADPATRAAYRNAKPGVQGLAADTAAAAPKEEPGADGQYRAPAQVPEIAQLTGDAPAVCAEYAPGEDQPRVTLDAQVEPITEPVGTAGRTSNGVPLADRVVVEPGYGVLVRAMDSPDAPAGTLNLVTDLGLRYPLSSDDVPNVLGYGAVTVVDLPSSLVVRLPAGPALDPEAAKSPLDED
ncbi:type VII secretion protein EccB [Symbioplanes lichenis]|uniref:type VII secretion protein EccB n=1 Tax=Symbioplanes lichenis TaxID=1629072 RepID=UPI0027399844|nr:type VII secretion protein EccB [Actinoplanes lichenis]